MDLVPKLELGLWSGSAITVTRQRDRHHRSPANAPKTGQTLPETGQTESNPASGWTARTVVGRSKARN